MARSFILYNLELQQKWTQPMKNLCRYLVCRTTHSDFDWSERLITNAIVRTISERTDEASPLDEDNTSTHRRLQVMKIITDVCSASRSHDQSIARLQYPHQEIFLKTFKCASLIIDCPNSVPPPKRRDQCQ